MPAAPAPIITTSFFSVTVRLSDPAIKGKGLYKAKKAAVERCLSLRRFVLIYISGN
jgi:hypothetical protein